MSVCVCECECVCVSECVCVCVCFSCVSVFCEPCYELSLIVSHFYCRYFKILKRFSNITLQIPNPLIKECFVLI